MKIKYLLVILSITFLTACEGVESTFPARKNILNAVFASGSIEAEDEYIVSSMTDAFIDASFFKEGDSVRKNQVLFKLNKETSDIQLENSKLILEDALAKSKPNSPQITQLNIQIEQAKAQVSLDKKNLERYKTLVLSKAVSQVDYERMKLQFELSEHNLALLEKNKAEALIALSLNVDNAQNQVKLQSSNNREYLIKADYDSQVLKVFKNEGELVRRGESLMKLASGNYIIKLLISEDDIHKVKLNQKLMVSLNTLRENTFEAIITKLHPAFDTQQQSFIVEAKFTQKPEFLLVGTQLQANIVVGQKNNALVIPNTYVLPNNKILVDKEKELPVKTGLRSGEWVEILSGINESTQIYKRK
ncbi:efflux RND transporter periplasmic adaptor subunit [Arcicella rigui]|uniref:HlyD family efflux transporter periplasmic adaptor subunit n=1 Tax=Arcicella rigui TaxID=797020 RepID=A0ABU5Q8S8_9BACT|nr:HlyD family efflux transporter periplasmic adaptor subunit [Arcicella rigui]MEA5139241.1 HlyD family efflux transporter periplasmic adaptor subunit [Arcicella rigui]